VIAAADVEREAATLTAGGHYVSPDSQRRITAATAAALLGKSEKTLANWWASDRRGPERLGGGAGRPSFYRLGDVLRYRDACDLAPDLSRVFPS
jgi:hypothetical protein